MHNMPLPDDRRATRQRRIHNPLEAMQPGEQVLCEIRRHPIGLIGPYFGAAIVVVGAAVAAVTMPYYLSDFTAPQTKLGILLGAGLAVIAALLYVYIATTIYTANRWILTGDSLTQVSQAGLFNSETSQLALEDLEDITIRQVGMLQSLVDFGTLHAETAGNRSKFVFPYCSDPEYFARQILTAREALINKTEAIPRP